MINYIPQPTITTCGQACVAMLANISIEEAIEKIGTDGPTGRRHIIKGLRKCGIKFGNEFIEISEENPTYPPVCVMLIRFPTYGHWVVHYHGKFYDPEFGLLDACVPHGRIFAYLEVNLME